MNYHNITYPDMNNGDGLRVVLWLSGCDHYCTNCQNPQTWDENSGILFDEGAKDELLRELRRDYISGITFTGGDPLYHKNLDEVLNLVLKIQRMKKTIWLYTGYSWEELLNSKDDTATKGCWKKRMKIVKCCDVMVDGPYIDNLRDVSLKWRGSSNQRVIDCKKSLKEGRIVLWVN